jgi:hypothetical protein
MLGYLFLVLAGFITFGRCSYIGETISFRSMITIIRSFNATRSKIKNDQTKPFNRYPEYFARISDAPIEEMFGSIRHETDLLLR